MNAALLAATISGPVSNVVAVVSYLLTRQQEPEAAWRKMNFYLYSDYVMALSSQLNDPTASHMHYIDATNALTLVAPPDVPTAVYALNDDPLSKQSGILSEIIQTPLTALRRDFHSRFWDKSDSLQLRLFRKSAVARSEPRVLAESK